MSLKDFIIPAIDIKDGKAVRLFKGDYNQITVYSDNPVDLAKDFEEKGAKHLHIVDLDGAKEGFSKNFKIVENIIKSVSILVEFGGGIRDYQTIKNLVSFGVSRIIIGSMIFEKKDEVIKAIFDFQNKIVIGIDAKDGKVAIKGWIETTEKSPLEIAKEFDNIPIWGFLYTDISRDGAMVGPNIEATEYLAKNLKHPVIASGGVSSIEDVKKLFKLKDLGVYGVVVGKAIYEGKIRLEDL
ncbi:1-(5-phosphoribosyl)-5-[(5-phosphoribosylamino)methylideneamino] imidazole-4-carboxamide isomerase [Venenivibrio stagnispumantis]|uniref:1-(5-phosphoribosyl)-5-[(5-phosphoribosylamino)methylideneamino] imidazole-4-carboxamide isomerase n=1 Tax=Venenivibrio stagnispumantis TaxID=407998 RepID=A0AA45WP24_9AQUI|nr:1-(5-phosphoribosyl)-5-[(5-phosphoribosylamino)methylideneamino]imidazole-4-carboxamide isomerase [Venenivibrio stagnispumantis]MCW4573794.1 1-(5-phosphoribosyl)-5-[(5-phosphoribosylamino)methylideneamino]imidazole-4-carboxamide isomerase [Venenivibrio stagnispumantis]SMP20300.1 1-(5-phosphoribosyl)-5-[(5-phosphoribosylamino)methylideneamino] imidazole-4-carboxamide isomerase [Venenivibrio stagnispumantis]